MKFDTTDPILQGATVHEADLRIWNYKSGGPDGQLCGDPLGAGIVAARVTAPWTLDGTADSLDWYNQPASIGVEGQNWAGYNYDADPSLWCAKDEELFHRVTGMARAWIEQDESNHGMVLRAATETAAINWRQYYSSQFGGGQPYPGYRHPPALLIRYTPAEPETETVIFRHNGPPLAEPPSYEQAVAWKVETYPEPVPPEAVTWEQLQELQTQVVNPFELKAEDLPDEPPSEEPDPADTAPPEVLHTVPSAAETNVPTSSRVMVRFDERVTGGVFSLIDNQGKPVGGQAEMDASGTLLEFRPLNRLSAGMTYRAEVSGAQDQAGNTQSPYQWSFTTDNTVPSVVQTSPASGATNVPVSTAVQATFNKAVSQVQLTVKDPAGAAVQGTLQGTDTNVEWTFTPASKLAAQTTYQVEVSGAKDASDNVMAPYTWSFTTGTDTPPPVPGLVAAYGMNEGSGTAVSDSSGQNNSGTGSSTTWANGKYGKALSFNGTSSWVTVPHAASLRLTTGMTLSAWVNPASVSGWSPVVGKELSDEAMSYTLYASNGSAPSGWVQTDPVTSWTVRGTSPLPVGTWSHVAVSYDGAALRLFVNGQQAGLTALSGSLYDDGSPLRIGGNAAWGEYFRGLIDEVRVYNHAQTAAQIQADMNTPIGGQPTPDTQPPSAPGSLAATGGSGTAQLTWTASTDNVGVDGYRIHRSTTPAFTPSAANQVGSSPATTFTDGGLAAGTYYYRVLAIDAAGNLSPSSAEVSATVTAPPASPGLVAAYSMNEAAGTAVADSSGQHNVGTATDTTWATGRHGGALSFNGTSSWVTVPHAASLRLTSTLTLSAWVRPSALGSLWRTVLMKERTGGGAYGLYASTETSGPGGWLQTTEETAGIGSRTALPLNQWSHVALTYDGATAVVYVNGTELGQVAVVGEVVDDGGVLRIGGNSFWGEFYSGLIDEVRVYNRVQTPAQIQADMNTPIGAAPTNSAAQGQGPGTADPATDITKLTVDGGRTVDGVTVVSTLTPQLTAWLPAERDGEAKVEMEIARDPAKPGKLAEPGKSNLAKTDKAAQNKHPIWTGQATAKRDDSQVTLQVPEGRLHEGETVRWRARIIAAGVNDAWTTWRTATINTTGGQPIRGGGQATQSAAVASPDFLDHFTTDTCRQEGWKDGRPVLHNQYRPFTWCFTWTYGVVLFHVVIVDGVKTKIPVGFTQFTATTMILTRIGNYLAQALDDYSRHSRDIDVWYKIEPWGVSINDNSITLNANITTAGHPSPGVCAVDGASSRKALRADWKSSPYAHFKIKSSTAASSGFHNQGTCRIGTHIEVGGYLNGKLLSDEDVEHFVTEPEVMCDTSPRYTDHRGGCVLGRGNRFLTYYENSTTHGEVARHIKSAFANTSKVIPGNYLEYIANGDEGKRAPLHRIWDKNPDGTVNKLYSDNVKAKDRACAVLTRPNATDQCDEYPFASSYEGAGRNASGTLTANVSYKYVSQPHNSSAGTSLRWFWQKYRLFEKDPFWIFISPGTGSQP
ncbi:MAG TPA: LamG-like jellyroll fold domain-containing protein [Nonomuraea sp.]|nr:LamG-like jellyroll fold domain-containing protein [Nonomuraea sp.]